MANTADGGRGGNPTNPNAPGARGRAAPIPDESRARYRRWPGRFPTARRRARRARPAAAVLAGAADVVF